MLLRMPPGDSPSLQAVSGIRIGPIVLHDPIFLRLSDRQSGMNRDAWESRRTNRVFRRSTDFAKESHKSLNA